MTVFGTAINLPHKAGTIVFVLVLISLVLFEGGLHELESACSKRGLQGLIKKLYKEFMILGLISFALFIVQEIYKYDPYDQWFLSFEFAHIVLLFVGINFVVESFLLVALIEGRNKTLLRHDNASSEQLLLEYLDLQQRGGFMKTLFNFGLVSIPVPELREKIEYKIIQEYFVRSYNLPAEFKFANYLCTLLKTFVFSLIEVRPVSWLLVAVLVVLNFVRIKVIDPIYETPVCEKFHTHFHHQVSPRYGEHVCQEYTLRYVFVCSMFLSVYLIGVFAASETYMQRLIDRVLDEEELLERLEKEEEDMADGVNGGFNEPALRKIKSEMAEFGGVVTGDYEIDLNTARNATLKCEPSSTTHADAAEGNSAHGSSATAPAERQLRRTISELNTTMDSAAAAPSRCHLYSLCLQRIMLVEFEYLAHQASPAGGSAMSPPQSPVPARGGAAATTAGHRSLGGARTSILRRLGSALSLAALTDAPPAAATSTTGPTVTTAATAAAGEEEEDDLSRDLELAATNRYKTVTSTVKAAALQSLARRSSSFALTPQEYVVGTTLSRHRSGFINSSNHGSAVGDALNGNGKKASFYTPISVSAKLSTYATVPGVHGGAAAGAVAPAYLPPPPLATTGVTTTAATATAALPVGGAAYGSTANGSAGSGSGGGGSRLRQSYQSSAQRAYSSHFFEMETPRSPRGLNAAQRFASALHIAVPDDSLCNRMYGQVVDAGKAVGRVMLRFWHLLIGYKAADNEGTDEDEDIQFMQNELSTLFVWSSPMLYFFTVEIALLLQCLYLALWATNFIVIARDSYYPSLWEAALLVPVPLNFWLIQKIIFSACTLKAVVSLNREVADRICEEALDARNVGERLRKIIRSTLAGLNFDKSKWSVFLHEQFRLFTQPGTAGLTEKQLRQFLHSLQIFLTDTSVSRIFGVIDFDRDGRVTWNDLSDIVFPELVHQQLKVNRKANTGKSAKNGRSLKAGSKAGSGQSGKSARSATSDSRLKGYSFADDQSSDAGSVARIMSFRPSTKGAIAAGPGKVKSCAVAGNSVLSESGTFGAGAEDEKEDSSDDYTPMFMRRNLRGKGQPEGVKFADASDISDAFAGSGGAGGVDDSGISGEGDGGGNDDDADGDGASEDGEGEGDDGNDEGDTQQSRYDAEDAEFGGRYINHRSIHLRHKLSSAKNLKQREMAEGLLSSGGDGGGDDGDEEEVFYYQDEDMADDFWMNASDKVPQDVLNARNATSAARKKKKIKFLPFMKK